MTKNLVLAGNFNLTMWMIVPQINRSGTIPVETSDTITILEKIGHFLDEENEILYRKFKKQGLEKREISHYIAKDLTFKDTEGVCKDLDGGYVIAGLLGHGDSFCDAGSRGDPSGFFITRMMKRLW